MDFDDIPASEEETFVVTDAPELPPPVPAAYSIEDDDEEEVAAIPATLPEPEPIKEDALT